MSDFEVVKTRGGAAAMLDKKTGEVMHPLTGPLEEPAALYVGPSRLEARLGSGSDALVLLDVGLGAGSNAIAAWAASEGRSTAVRPLHLVSFDRTLEPLTIAMAPAHREAFGLAGDHGEACAALLRGGRAEGKHTVWRVVVGDVPGTLLAESGRADVVFWDPFSPRATPALWSVAAFTALRRACRDGATVHTYSGATSTRTSMLLAGFAVGFGRVLSPGRRSTIAATRREDLDEPLDARWFDRLARSTAAFADDAPPDALARVRAG
ncbi:MAG TPA: MnmC family methyltransferase [Polyangiaceae bacterium]|jgi:queuine tRNA-ribosyltransferase|nr:MnmC family methyltransferase [Polyangiaceae bacterium]